MSRPPGSYGHAAMLGVLAALLLLITAGVFLFMSRYGAEVPSSELALTDPAADARRVARDTILLTILLISALLILLFVVGCYLVLRVGRIVRRPTAGGPTPYVDAWRSYRLTDDQIASATAEEPEPPPPTGPSTPRPEEPQPPG